MENRKMTPEQKKKADEFKMMVDALYPGYTSIKLFQLESYLEALRDGNEFNEEVIFHNMASLYNEKFGETTPSNNPDMAD